MPGRREDGPLLRGRATFIADIRRPRMVEACFVRSQIAHGEVRAIDSATAQAIPGVLGVFTADDLAGVNPIPDFHALSRGVEAFPLCRDRVRYVGAPLAVAVAADRYVAEDAAELVRTDIAALPAVTDLLGALGDDAPLLYSSWPDNRLVRVDIGNPEPELAEVFARHQIVSHRYTVKRHGAVPLETRGVVAEYADDRLTVWTSTQYPAVVRTMLSDVLGLPEHRLRVVAPAVGGGFGQKAQIYPEEYVIPWLAMHLERPVRWIEDRYENLVAGCHARDVVVDVEAAVRDDGTIAGLRGRVLHDLGSGEISPPGFNPSIVAVGMMTGPYRVPSVRFEVVGVVTNKTPSGAYRGFGQPEGAFVMDRIIERIAAQRGADSIDLRRRMIITPDELPYVSATGNVIDSGSHLEAFEQAVTLSAELLADARREQAEGVLLGVGVTSFCEGVAASYRFTSGRWGDQETADIRLEPDGSVVVAVGLSAMGQSTETMVATLVSQILGIDDDKIRVVLGDTDAVPHGLGSFASRSTIVAAGAITKAAGPLIEKGRLIAAHRLEAAPDDVVFENGRFAVKGSPQRATEWPEIARVALIEMAELPEDIDPGLHSIATYRAPGITYQPDERGRVNANASYTNATHCAVVSVRLDTGEVRVERYGVVHDCGTVVNPAVVAGQVHGGVAQGIGGALLESFTFDAAGQPQATSFMTYLLPTSAEIPPIVERELVSPARSIPLGVKGIGESGIIGPPAAILSAVEDAVGHLGLPHLTETPLLPDQLLSMLEASGSLAPT